MSSFARAAGVDRSTLAQFLSGDDYRLPRADTLIAVANQAGVSTDWLLGLSEQEEVGAGIISALLQIEGQGDLPVDDAFMRWLSEAEGTRIRTVPIALPDFTKTEALLRFEYRGALGDAPGALGAVRARLDYMRSPDSDVEVCLALQPIQAMVKGEERWSGLPVRVRREQIDYMATICRDAYPGLRVYIYDVRDVYSVPFTVFGRKRAVVFLGPNYLVLNSTDHIRLFARRFDDLIRRAVVQPHDVERKLRDLGEAIGRD